MIIPREEAVKSVNILNVSIDNLSLLELLNELKVGGVVFTPNIDHIMKLQKDRSFYNIYHQADYRVCDSQLLMLASRFLGQPIKEKISGSDLFPAFYEHYQHDEEVKIFLLGGVEGAAEIARKNINAKVGRDMIIDSYCPPFGFEKDEAECDKIIQLINNSEATVLAVGVGAPKQEKWINSHKSQLNKIKTFFAIGGTIEFEADFRARAPKWVSQAGLEWLYRLMQEPKRLWRRYLLEDIPFFFLILKQKLQLQIKN
ncbi:exopolysaccharide biosynthesis protein, WecB/TagA/CpsF family [Xenococcus sp. PCC 7305]|uniref:WecB/TagA/CpsF family glycosyltransferase n=1 Tax=Xenococcus sp. PCC 7305 TaxID=102125 RepID=UPI0002AC19D3|nr:WecB/TagA/CpsF family glycosyltransferase [Xenococcus sp. PCC 7305]ELS02634.1 exopolysaccharide biosynthesis protein, WecB/TagA/CpsF family [Xenococcus sp. PCC 7305]